MNAAASSPKTGLRFAGLYALVAAAVLVSNRANIDGSNWLRWLTLGLITSAFCTGFTALAWRLNQAKRNGLPMPLSASLSTAAVIGGAFALTVAIGSNALDLETTQPLGNQLAIDFTVITVGAFLLITWVAKITERNTKRAELLDEATSLYLARADAAEISDRIQLILSNSVDDALASARAAIDSQLVDQGQHLIAEKWQAIASNLRTTADQTVRTFSKDLWRQATAAEKPVTAVRILRDIINNQPFQVGLIVLIYLITAPGDVIQNLGFLVGAFNLLSGVISIVLVLGGANALMKRAPRYHALIFVSATLLLQALGLTMWVWRDIWSDTPYTVVDFIVSGLFGVVWIFLTSGVGSLRKFRAQTEENFELELSQDFLATAAANRRLAQLARESARILHGSVQTRLIACAIAIEQAAEKSDTEAFLRAMNEARDVLAASPLTDPALPTSLADEVARKVGLWSGLCAIDVQIYGADSTTTSEPSPHTIRDVGRVVEEGLSNAIRHGGATTARVSITLTDESVAIRIEDDGSGLAATARSGAPGLGSSLLDNLTDQWKLIDSSTLSPTGATLEVTLLLSPATAQNLTRAP